MVVKNQIKFVKSLQQKKYRNKNKLFVAEGIKLVVDLLKAGVVPESIYCTDDDVLGEFNIEYQTITESELGRMSGLKTPSKVLGVFKYLESEPLDFSDWILALDDIQDPGNLGTIIRLCDWFGINHLLCSPNTVDCYNPKTLQATMGSIARVNIVYGSILDFTKECGLPLYGAFMEGDLVYEQEFPSAGILVMGNEGHGISTEIQRAIESSISIPQYGNSNIDSLNVAMATAILLSELRRPSIQK